jgi:hypothetical protein
MIRQTRFGGKLDSYLKTRGSAYPNIHSQAARMIYRTLERSHKFKVDGADRCVKGMRRNEFCTGRVRVSNFAQTPSG